MNDKAIIPRIMFLTIFVMFMKVVVASLRITSFVFVVGKGENSNSSNRTLEYAYIQLNARVLILMNIK